MQNSAAYLIPKQLARTEKGVITKRFSFHWEDLYNMVRFSFFQRSDDSPESLQKWTFLKRTSFKRPPSSDVDIWGTEFLLNRFPVPRSPIYLWGNDFENYGDGKKVPQRAPKNCKQTVNDHKQCPKGKKIKQTVNRAQQVHTRKKEHKQTVTKGEKVVKPPRNVNRRPPKPANTSPNLVAP